FGRVCMQSLLSIFREVRDPRDFNARHELPAILFIALAATLCGAKSCVAIADFAAAYVELLAEIVELPHGAAASAACSVSWIRRRWCRFSRGLSQRCARGSDLVRPMAWSLSMASACGAAMNVAALACRHWW